MDRRYETFASNNKIYTLPVDMRIQNCCICCTVCVRNRHHYPHWVRAQVERLSHHIAIPELDHHRPVCASCALRSV